MVHKLNLDYDQIWIIKSFSIDKMLLKCFKFGLSKGYLEMESCPFYSALFSKSSILPSTSTGFSTKSKRGPDGRYNTAFYHAAKFEQCFDVV